MLGDLEIDTTSSKPESVLIEVRQHCDRRLGSAKKMRAALKDAAQREEADLQRIKDAKAADKKRQLEARDRRKGHDAETDTVSYTHLTLPTKA